jgi:Uncharacterized protein containing a Zn-ribbon (DUF2116)
MVKTCASCGLVVNDDAHFCEKCGYEFGKAAKAKAPAFSKNRIIGFIVLLIVLAVVAIVGVHFRSATMGRESTSVQRSEMVRQLKESFPTLIHDPGAQVSENRSVLVLQSNTFASSAEFRSSFVVGLKQHRDRYCSVGFQQVRLMYGGANEDYPLECTDSPAVRQRSASAEDRAKVVQELQGSWKDGVVSEQGDMLHVENESFADPLVRANVWRMLREGNFLNAHHLCESEFHEIRLAYGNEAEDFSLGCGGNPPSEIKLLMLISDKWHIEYGYAMMEGQVMNISGQRLEGVTAVVTFYDAKGEFITSQEALIAYNPILPNQASAFKVPAAYNPEMRKAAVEFKYLMGGSIPLLRNPKFLQSIIKPKKRE